MWVRGAATVAPSLFLERPAAVARRLGSISRVPLRCGGRGNLEQLLELALRGDDREDRLGFREAEFGAEAAERVGARRLEPALDPREAADVHTGPA